MLINPEGHDFALRWHRDDVGEKASEEEEREALGKWRFGVSVHGHPRSPILIDTSTRSSGTRTWPRRPTRV